MAKRVVIGGQASGVGKTTVAVGLMAALVKRGYEVRGFKVGPDFIDPGHHWAVTGRPSYNLDGWMLSPEYNHHLYIEATRDINIAVVEGVMGLFDGRDSLGDAGSTAEMAKWLNAPVVLVTDASSLSRSLAALVLGFATFDEQLKVAGAICNRVGGDYHSRLLREALSQLPDVAFFGGLPKNEQVAVPERHLGLTTREETDYTDLTDALADMAERHLDIDGILDAASDGPLSFPAPPARPIRPRPPSVKIGVARDRAFCFYYQDNLDILSTMGAQLVFFSPIEDTGLPEGVSGLYLGGGYPELFAEPLCANVSMKKDIAAAADSGMPVLAECGGFMYLGREIISEGTAYPMVGLFPTRTRMVKKLQALGYREAVLQQDGLLGPKGTVIRGHEFHYSRLEYGAAGLSPTFRVTGRTKESRDGFVVNNVLAGYMHLHFGSNPKAAESFVSSCTNYRAKG